MLPYVDPFVSPDPCCEHDYGPSKRTGSKATTKPDCRKECALDDARVPLGAGPQLLAATFLNNVNTFVAEITTLHELVATTRAQLEPQDRIRFDERVQELTAGSVDGLLNGDKVRVAQAARAWFESMQALPQEGVGLAFGIPVGSEHATAVAMRAEAAFQALIAAFPDAEHAGRFVLGFADALSAVPRADVMYASLVVAGVSSFRTLLRGIALEVGHRDDPALGEPELIARLERLIERRGLPDWDLWFGTKIGVTVGAAISDDAKFREIFSRRDVIVHHGGLVSRRYLSAWPGTALGKRLLTDAAYAEGALDHLLTAGLVFLSAAWSAIAEPLGEPSQQMLNYNLLKYVVPVGRWQVVHDVSTWLVTQARSESIRAVAVIHAALASKRAGHSVEAHAALRDWRTPSPDVELARLSLLDQLDEAFRLANELLRSGTITRRDLETWPALAELRADPRFHGVIQSDEG